MDSYTNKDYEQEIDLKDLMFSVLRKWRGIILVAIAFAVLLGGYKMLKGMNQLKDPQYIKNSQEEYDESFKNFETKKERLEREIQNIENGIESQNDYNEKSILMKINPLDEAVASTTLYITADYQAMQGPAYQNPVTAASILRAYMSIAQSEETYKDILKGMNEKAELQYLVELVELEADYAKNILDIKVIGATDEQAGNIMDGIMNGIFASQDKITASIGPHSLDVVDSSKGTEVDLDLDRKQKNALKTAQDLDTSLTEKTKELKELAAPAVMVVSTRSVLTGAIKYAVLGGVLGAFMMVFFICVAFLMSDNMVSGKELKRRYGIMILGTFKKNGKKRPFAFVDRWIDNMEGTSRTELEHSRTFEIIAANTLNYAEDSKNILLIGSVDSSELSRIKAGLGEHLPGVSLSEGGDVCKDAQAIKTLAVCDAVIVVEKRNKSSFGVIEQELDLVSSLNKKILGCVVL